MLLQHRSPRAPHHSCKCPLSRCTWTCPTAPTEKEICMRRASGSTWVLSDILPHQTWHTKQSTRETKDSGNSSELMIWTLLGTGCRLSPHDPEGQCPFPLRSLVWHRTSGADQAKVPTLYKEDRNCRCMILAKPTSAILAVLSRASSMLADFRSKCTILLECRKCRPRAASSAMRRPSPANRGPSGALLHHWKSVTPNCTFKQFCYI